MAAYRLVLFCFFFNHTSTNWISTYGHTRSLHYALPSSYPRAEHVIAVSEGVAQDLQQNFAIPADQISVVANPVDHERIAAMAAIEPDRQDRKSTRLNSITNAHLVCRLLLEQHKPYHLSFGCSHL